MQRGSDISTSPSPATSGGRVLLVEDDAGIRQLITFVLERSGYDVTAVSGQSDAEQAIGAGTEYVAAVVDLCLPDGRGDWIVHLLREQSPDTRIVVTSAFAHASLVLQIASESGDAFLTKPFTNAALIAAVSQPESSSSMAR